MSLLSGIVRTGQRQRGFTLLEILVAMTVGLFLLGALLAVEQSNHDAFLNQNKLVQVQDQERMAMTLVADVIQAAGYFPYPLTNNINSLPATTQYGTFAGGQSVTYDAAAAGDSVVVRFMTTGGDGVMNCNGSTNTNPSGPATLVYVNEFSVVGGQLVCTLNGVAYPLVDNINKMTVMFGITSTPASSPTNVDTYLTAAQTTAAAAWDNVVSIVVTLEVNNPLYVAGQAQPATISISRTINVMGRTGLSS